MEETSEETRWAKSSNPLAAFPLPLDLLLPARASPVVPRALPCHRHPARSPVIPYPALPPSCALNRPKCPQPGQSPAVGSHTNRPQSSKSPKSSPNRQNRPPISMDRHGLTKPCPRSRRPTGDATAPALAADGGPGPDGGADAVAFSRCYSCRRFMVVGRVFSN
uniref:Uncharacterized protein n=1 Tax=Arundo donax TaxID=35708 RepID=A0A0A9HGN2_ARUDO